MKNIGLNVHLRKAILALVFTEVVSICRASSKHSVCMENNEKLNTHLYIYAVSTQIALTDLTVAN